jgi:hypothetical protein
MLLIPSAAAILHLSAPRSHPNSKHTKPGALTLAQLQAASSSSTFQAVVPISLLDYDHRDHTCHGIPTNNPLVSSTQQLSISSLALNQTILLHEDIDDLGSSNEYSDISDEEADQVDLQMLEAQHLANEGVIFILSNYINNLNLIIYYQVL